jgi:hypothetical protein
MYYAPLWLFSSRSERNDHNFTLHCGPKLIKYVLPLLAFAAK